MICTTLPIVAAIVNAATLAGTWTSTHVFGPAAPPGVVVVRSSPWKTHDTRYADGSELRVRFADAHLIGQWIQPANAENSNRVTSPITFINVGQGRWRGVIRAAQDFQHLLLYVRGGPDGTAQAFFRNPERNAGARVGMRDVKVSGDFVHLRRSGAPDIVGRWSRQSKTLTLQDPGLPGTFVFTRIDESPLPQYRYARPSETGDGWHTGTLAEVGMDGSAIVSLINKIRSTAPSLRAPYIQSLLIARHGRLVLDAYFNGYDASRPHDVRSAGKSVTTLLVGKAIEHSRSFSPGSRVAAILSQYSPFANDDGRKERITLSNLMSMSAGYACDDNDGASPGGEDRMQSQIAQPDWYKFTVDLPMLFDPGSHALYCSAEINLLGAIVSKETRSWLPDYFYDNFARPMDFGPYAMWLVPPPVDDAYMAGGDEFRPRDFLKFGQLFLNGGRWNGRQIVAASWLAECGKKHAYVEDGGGDYGYGWHLSTFHVRGRTIHAISAGGNGGQLLYVVPQLDMAVIITAANYGQYPVWNRFGKQIVEDGILPATR